jgi:hypothetical protein
MGKVLGCNRTKGTPITAAENPPPSQSHMGGNALVRSTATPLEEHYKQLGKLIPLSPVVFRLIP